MPIVIIVEASSSIGLLSGARLHPNGLPFASCFCDWSSQMARADVKESDVEP